MAPWVGAGGVFARSLGHPDDRSLRNSPSSRGARTPIIPHDDCHEYDSDDTSLYPHRTSWDLGHDIATPPAADWSPKQPQFFVIREGTPASREELDGHRHTVTPRDDGHLPPEPAPVACFMERTNSGHTIVNDSDSHSNVECTDFSPEEDMAAAARVRMSMNNPRRDVRRHERILRSLVHPKDHRGADFALDETALESIFSAADEIFFQGRLSHRVQWEWSSGDQNDYSSRIIGTTALRKAQPPIVGGYETLIVLSSPLLRDTKYNRRLLISTFLHELIHSYLFICCGFKARHCGGHTPGFKQIAAIIDEWSGRGTLRLCDMEADLAHFKEVERSSVIERPQPSHYDFGYSSDSSEQRFDMARRPGSRVVLHTHGRPGSIGPASNNSTPLSSTSSLFIQDQRELFRPDEALPRLLEAAHMFAGSASREYY